MANAPETFDSLDDAPMTDPLDSAEEQPLEPVDAAGLDSPTMAETVNKTQEVTFEVDGDDDPYAVATNEESLFEPEDDEPSSGEGGQGSGGPRLDKTVEVEADDDMEPEESLRDEKARKRREKDEEEQREKERQAQRAASAPRVASAGEIGWTILLAACVILVGFPLVFMISLIASGGYTHGAPTNNTLNPFSRTGDGFIEMNSTGKFSNPWDTDWFKSIQKVVMDNPAILTVSSDRISMVTAENEWWGRPVNVISISPSQRSGGGQAAPAMGPPSTPSPGGMGGPPAGMGGPPPGMGGPPAGMGGPPPGVGGPPPGMGGGVAQPPAPPQGQAQGGVGATPSGPPPGPNMQWVPNVGWQDRN